MAPVGLRPPSFMRRHGPYIPWPSGCKHSFRRVDSLHSFPSWPSGQGWWEACNSQPWWKFPKKDLLTGEERRGEERRGEEKRGEERRGSFWVSWQSAQKPNSDLNQILSPSVDTCHVTYNTSPLSISSNYLIYLLYWPMFWAQLFFLFEIGSYCRFPNFP